MPRARRSDLISAVAGLVLAFGLSAAQAADGAQWTPAPWRFLRDGWPNGIGFDCQDCGVPISVYVRVKIGFCDCSKGVSDDDEIDRVGDVDLVAPEIRPSGPGGIAPVAGSSGRMRVYRAGGPVVRDVATLAVGRDCNAIVATAVSDGRLTPERLTAVSDLTARPEVARFITDKLSGR